MTWDEIYSQAQFFFFLYTIKAFEHSIGPEGILEVPRQQSELGLPAGFGVCSVV